MKFSWLIWPARWVFEAIILGSVWRELRSWPLILILTMLTIRAELQDFNEALDGEIARLKALKEARR